MNPPLPLGTTATRQGRSLIAGTVILGSLAVLFLFGGCSGKTSRPTPDPRPELTIFVAASLTDVITELGQAFEAETGSRLFYNFASSGALAQQVTATDTADLFLSASERWMDHVAEAGKVSGDLRRSFLSNQLVLVARNDTGITIDDPADLCTAPFRFLSVGDPAHVPAGRYAREWLQSVFCDNREPLWDALGDRISPAPDVRAALAQVEGGKDILGVVYRTDYQARQDRFRLLYSLPPGEGPAIRYSVAVLNGADHHDLAQAFFDYLSSQPARILFERHGFSLPPTTAPAP